MRSILFSLVFTVNQLLAQNPTYRITSTGYGPVRVGMTLSEASNVLGVSINTPDPPNDDCYYAIPSQGHEGLVFVLINNKIARASISGKSAIKSDAGIGIGDSVDKVKKYYGKQLESKPHTYVDDGVYITFWASTQKARGIRYEIVSGKVDTIHGGDKSIRLVEGCL